MPMLTLSDGRLLDVRDSGPAGAPTLVFHHGTPGTGTPERLFLESVQERGWRLVTWSRPGYATSSRHRGRTVASVVDDAVEVLDALGIDRAATLGWSGGGPHTIACGALRPDRFPAVGVIAGVAPYAESLGSLDFLAGMGEANVVEFGAAVRGEDDVREFLAAYGEAFATITADDIVTELSSLLPPVDREHLTDEHGEAMAASIRESVSHGIDGMVDDDLAFVEPWGFDLAAIEVPVSIWQGTEDLMVPFAHGPWLVEHIPTARPHLLEGEGHLSIGIGRQEDILDELLGLSGL
jgi:pimeloyl-ACP methyl ester carboxylesterase